MDQKPTNSGIYASNDRWLSDDEVLHFIHDHISNAAEVSAAIAEAEQRAAPQSDSWEAMRLREALYQQILATVNAIGLTISAADARTIMYRVYGLIIPSTGSPSASTAQPARRLQRSELDAMIQLARLDSRLWKRLIEYELQAEEHAQKYPDMDDMPTPEPNPFVMVRVFTTKNRPDWPTGAYSQVLMALRQVIRGELGMPT